jgi:hypothetical protein
MERCRAIFFAPEFFYYLEVENPFKTIKNENSYGAI